MKTKFKFSERIQKDSMFLFLFLLTIGSSIGFQGWRTLFNNFAIDQINLSGFSIGSIQSFREIPGFLSFAVVFILFFIKEHKLAVYSVMILGIGVFITGLFPSFIGLLTTTFIMSTGFHYFETTNQSLTLQSFGKTESPYILASMKSANAVANISVGALILFLSTRISFEYNYMILGILVLIFAIIARIKMPQKTFGIPQQKKMIFKKKYWLFYVLNFLSGARRQIFVVFAVLLLVSKYNFTVTEVAILFIINNVIAIIVNPIIAKMINNFGERTTLTVEYIFLTLIFFSYAYFDTPWIAGCLYILDSIFFNFSIGIKTYFQKHAQAEDIAPSMAVGFTINHIAAIILPIAGGALWLINWKIPFIGALVLSIISLVFVQFMKPNPNKISLLKILKRKMKSNSHPTI